MTRTVANHDVAAGVGAQEFVQDRGSARIAQTGTDLGENDHGIEPELIHRQIAKVIVGEVLELRPSLLLTTELAVH